MTIPPAERATSIRRRLLAWLVLPATLILLAGTGLDAMLGRAPVRDAYDASLLDSALAIAANVRVGAAGHVDVPLAAEAVGILRADSVDSIYYRVNAPDGTFVAGDRDLVAAATGAANPGFRTATYHGEQVRIVDYRKATSAGPVEVWVAETLRKRERFEAQLWTSALATDLGVLAALLALVWFGVRNALQPLDALARQVERRQPRELRPLDPSGVPQEVSGLVTTLNHFFDTIIASNRWQQQFMEAAAHQLRTPLAGIQAQLEQLVGDDPDVDRRERLALALGATRRLSRTTQQFLALARSGDGSYRDEQFAAVDLARVAGFCLSGRLGAGQTESAELAAELEPASVRGVEWLLTEAVTNLIDNAIKYTPPGGSVTVRTGVEAHSPFVEVRDTGVGIPAADRDRVTARFVRGRFAVGDGSGLGLSIVAEVCRAHGASLRISAGTDGRGSVVRLEFPRIDAA